MGTIVERNRPLRELLSLARPEALAVLADILTDHGKGRVSLGEEAKARILHHQSQGSLAGIAAELEDEICRFGGNTLVNAVRSRGVAYEELARDVAGKLGLKVAKASDTHTVEDAVIDHALKTELQALDEAGRRAFLIDRGEGRHAAPPPPDANTASGRLVQALGSAGAASLTAGLALSSAGVASVVRTGVTVVGGRALAAVNPVLVVGAAVYEASGPAFRVTVPLVVQVACIRRARMAHEFQYFRERLNACL
jgi:uncharacterized protein YaaW (UPF0174 family)